MKHLIIGLYIAVAFTSAFLLFWIQPVIARYLTPILGGSPMVWNTLLFFFQFFLLLGYAYSSFLSKWGWGKKALIAHIVVMVGVLWCLPIDLTQVSSSPSIDHPIGWLAWNVFLVIGIPYFLLATTAPILQMWYAQTFKTEQPYFLYAISNIGSFVALFGFLFFIEPAWGTFQQVGLWTSAFFAFVMGLFLCAGYLLLKNTPAKHIENTNRPAKSIRWGNKIRWFSLAFVPASLLHGVTIYITNDLLALPVFWIVPLGLYLLTFVVAFTVMGQKMHSMIRQSVLIAAFAPLLLLFWVDPLFNLTLLVLHIVSFVILSLACHGELYKSRPDVNNIGLFYLWIAIGGACAGFFNVVIAPYIFNTIFEYPISIALAVFVLIYQWNGVYRPSYRSVFGTIFSVCLVGGIVSVIYYNLPDLIIPDIRFHDRPLNINMFNPISLFGLLVLMAMSVAYLYVFRRNAFNIATMFLMMHLIVSATTNHSLFSLYTNNKFEHEKTVFIDRNFYGVIRVIDDSKSGLRKYYNGVGGHSAKAIESVPSPSIHTGGYRSVAMKQAKNMGLPTAVLGMGPARYQCFADKGQMIEYFEINPAVVSMAMDDTLFGYLKYCDGHFKVHIGDARLELSKQADQKYGAIISTVYWSSTVPFHLFTKEALDMYLSKLADGGYFSIIIPNHFFDFSPLFAAYNRQSPYDFHLIQESGNPFFRTFIMRKEVGFKVPSDWQTIDDDQNIKMWQDDFYNLLDVFKNPKNMRLTRDKKRFDLL